MASQIIKGKVTRIVLALMRDSLGSSRPGGLKNMSQIREAFKELGYSYSVDSNIYILDK